MIKKIGLMLLVFFVLCMLLYLFPWKYKVNTTLQGVQCRIGDKEYAEDVSIKIKGTYNNYLFKTTLSVGPYQ